MTIIIYLLLSIVFTGAVYLYRELKDAKKEMTKEKSGTHYRQN